MITTTLGQLVNAEPALTRVSAERLPAKTAYQVAKLLRLCGVEIAHFNTQRQALFAELGVERPATDDEQKANSGATVREIPPASIPAFHQRLQAVADVAVEIGATPVPIDTLGTISAADILALGPLVTGDDV